MTKKRKNRTGNVRIRGVRREKVDVRKLGHVIIALAQAQAEKEAQEAHEAAKKNQESA